MVLRACMYNMYMRVPPTTRPLGFPPWSDTYTAALSAPPPYHRITPISISFPQTMTMGTWKRMPRKYGNTVLS